jgi:RNA polymerase sigma-70 factor, ECF subfamily
VAATPDAGQSPRSGHADRPPLSGAADRPPRSGDADRPDDELVRAARDGDVAALDAFLRCHHPRLLAMCRRLTGDPTDAEDACQEALLALARGLHRFDGRSAFTTWAYRVTTNACLDELRRRRRRPVPGLGGPNAETGVRGPNAATGVVPGEEAGDPGDGVAARLDVDAALAAIAPDFRAAVVLRDLCQLSYEEIADVLGMPPGTVRSRIARGRAALLPLLGNPSPPGERRTR